MTEYELATRLRHVYEDAKRNETVLQIHLFAIEYADEIKKNHYRISDLVKTAGISSGYAAEVSKGVKLAQYVELKEAREWKEQSKVELSNGK